jgi:hypothetical protein
MESCPSHFGCSRAGPATALLATLMLLATATDSLRADADCATAFERWSKVSTARLRMQAAAGATAAGATQQEACIPTEVARQGLLQSLAKARSTCEQASALDPSIKHTKEMLDINASFISSVVLCRGEGTGKTAETEVAPPPKQLLRQRNCLVVSKVNPEHFALSNSKCGGRTVLAVIEKQGPSGKIDCKAYSIGHRLVVATTKDASPHVNYQCVLEQGSSCTKEEVATIFPECDW